MEIIKVDMWGKGSLVDGGLRIHWSHDELGFGAVTLYTVDDKSYIDTEYMGKEFAVDLFLKLLEESELV